MQKLKGSCHCSALSFEVVKAFGKRFFCSCDQCRQINGSAFASKIFVGSDGFNWLGGAEEIVSYQVPGLAISKTFCRICSSGVSLFCNDGSKVIVPASSLHRERDVTERFRTFRSDLDCFRTGDLSRCQSGHTIKPSRQSLGRTPAMTDIKTHPQSLPLSPEVTRGLRFPAALLKHLFRSHRSAQIDLHHASDHMLKDIGVNRSQNIPPISSLGRIW